MKLINQVNQAEVCSHWKRVEKLSGDRFRGDIREDLVEKYDVNWFLAEIEEKDLGKIFIISSGDWKVITKTFSLLDTVASFDKIVNERIMNVPRELFQKVSDIQIKKLLFKKTLIL